jgi:hypothetical protein
MIERVINIIKDYIDRYQENGLTGNYQWIHDCVLTTVVTPTYMQLGDISREKNFSIIIHRDTNRINVNGVVYYSEYNFMEIFIELEKINNISFTYVPSFMGEVMEEDMVVYHRNKNIEDILT